MTIDPPARPASRRLGLAVLAVIAIAVAMLGLLVAETSRHSIDGARMNVAGHQRMLSERLVALTLLARAAPPAERAIWRPRIDATAAELRLASQRLRGIDSGDVVIPPGTLAAYRYETLIALQDSVKASAARAAADDATPAEVDVLLVQQKRLAVAIEFVADELEREWVRQVDNLLLLEVMCVALLLMALGFGTWLVLQPTRAHLTATVQALAESESRSDAVLDAMPNGMILTSADGHIVSWNPSALAILELSPDAKPIAIEDVVRQFGGEDGAPLGSENLPSRITMRTGSPRSRQILTTRSANGGVKYLSANTSPLFRAGVEKPHAAVTIFRDMTSDRMIEEERVAQAEALAMQNQELLEQAEALERGHALFRSLVDTTGSAIIGIGADGKVFEWNAEAETMYGIPRANALGREYVTEFVTPKYRDRIREGMNAVLRGHTIRNRVAPVKDQAGERHMVLWNITPLRSGPGLPVHGLIAGGLDITEREASDQRFRLLFERSTDAHMLYDAEGIIDCNQTTLRMLRVASVDALLGRRPAELSPLRQPDGRLSVVVAGQMRERARITGYHRFEWTHRRDDGTLFPVEVTLTPLRLHGRNVMLAVWHDIAERKAVEDALRLAKESAESASRTKSEFMTRMNHELRTPLTAIIGFSRVLLKGKAGELPPGAQAYADRILVNGMHLLSLINQILDVAKVEAGRMDVERETVDLRHLINETLEMLESTAESKGLAVRREIPETLAPLETDAGKLRQILINLIGNAIKFTAAGEVLVRVTTDPLTGNAREIIVSDTGIGIPAPRRNKIFEPFEQGDSSTRHEFGGTGLGLSIVKTFARLIGSTIMLESEVGVGTTFTLRLPAPTPAAPSGVVAGTGV